MSDQNPQEHALSNAEGTRNDEFDAGAISAQVAGLNAAVKHIQGQMETLTADLDGTPPVTADQSAATLEDLHAQVQHLTSILAEREAPIAGVGQAVQPRAPPVRHRPSARDAKRLGLDLWRRRSQDPTARAAPHRLPLPPAVRRPELDRCL